MSVRIAKAHAAPSEAFISSAIGHKTGLSGLHLNCANGEDTFLISSLSEAEIYALDEDAALIQEARQRSQQFGQEEIKFVQHPLMEWQEIKKRNFDFVYIRSWKGGLADQQVLVKKIHQQLKEGGLFLLELMQFSGYQSYPYNHAFARVSDLMTQIEAIKAVPDLQWERILKHAGFTHIEQQTVLQASFLLDIVKSFRSSWNYLPQ